MATSFGGHNSFGQSGELEARRSPNAFNDWFARRTVWVRLQSYSSGCGSYKELTGLKNNIPYEEGYNGSRPQPIITGVKVTSAGNLGTIREATVNIIAFTNEQLNDLEACYLIPKMSVTVSFGWSVGASGAVPAGGISGASDNAIQCSLKGLWPVGDGVHGRVSKYEVSFNKDGMWWELSVKIVGIGNAALTAPAEDFTNTCKCDTASSPAAQQKEVDEDTKAEASGFKQVFIHLCEYASKNDDASYNKILGYGSQFGAAGSTYAAILNNKNRWKTSLLEDIAGYIPDFLGQAYRWIREKVSGDANPWSSMEAYITVDGIVKAWEMRSTSQCDNGPIWGKFDNTKGGLISGPPSVLQSANPHKALFPPEDGYEKLTAGSCFSGGKVLVGKILVNTIFANQCLEDCGKQATFEDFMSKILQGINDAAGGLWELTIINTGDCSSATPIYSIIDLQAVQSVAPTNIPLNPKTAVVREVGLSLKMTDAMQTQALYGAVRQGKKDQPCDEKRFTNVLQATPNSLDPNGCKVPAAPSCGENADLGCEPASSGESSNFPAARTAMQKDTGNPDLMEACYTALANSHNVTGASLPTQCKNVILPYEFSFTIDGIGGFEFGQMVTSNILPANASAVYVYQVTAVEHNVTHGDWTTTVKTVPRYK